MDSLTVSRYLRMFEPLTTAVKLELIIKLTDSVRKKMEEQNDDKKTLLMELEGAWIDVDDSIVDEIDASRTISDKQINFD